MLNDFLRQAVTDHDHAVQTAKNRKLAHDILVGEVRRLLEPELENILKLTLARPYYDKTKTIGELLAARPTTVQPFDEHGISLLVGQDHRLLSIVVREQSDTKPMSITVQITGGERYVTKGGKNAEVVFEAEPLVSSAVTAFYKLLITLVDMESARSMVQA